MAKCQAEITITRARCSEIHCCDIEEDEHTEERANGEVIHECECGKEWGDTECD